MTEPLEPPAVPGPAVPPPPEPPAADARGHAQFPCGKCGARLHYRPGTTSLRCDYCGHENEIVVGTAPVEELDYREALARGAEAETTEERLSIRCDGCAAETAFPPNVTATKCPFCAKPLVAARSSSRRIKPRALLPFALDARAALDRFRAWIGSRWFAPNGLKQFAVAEGRLSGVYLPHWTYDSRTDSDYTGERGDDYWDTETYTALENGRHVTKTRRVQRTRWSPAAGAVACPFDDVLVPASQSLPAPLAAGLPPWDLDKLAAYDDAFLSGFSAECYAVGLEDGFEAAKVLMDPQIRSAVAQDIGGDHQRIHELATRYHDITFKHILLPIWVAAYSYRGKVFRILINGRTGKVVGDRPYSAAKIAILVAVVLAVIALLVLLSQGH